MPQPRLPYFDYVLAELEKQNPVIEKSFGQHAHWGYWDEPESARCDDDDYALAAENLALRLCAMAGIAEGERVLDVGCGFGGTAATLTERFAALRITGLNIDGRQLARARNIARPARDNSITWCQADACSLPFAAGSFDRLLAVECIFHFSSRAAFFAEAHRVLAPGGTLTISDFIPAPVILPLNRVTASAWFDRHNVFGHCSADYTIARYRRLAARTGFRIGAARNVTRHVQPTYSYLLRQLAGAPLAGYPRRLTLAVRPLIGLLRLTGRLRLFNYYFLSFTRAGTGDG